MNYKYLLYSFRNSTIYRILSLIYGSIAWSKRGFASPSPQYIKQKCLLRNASKNSIWVETGTYLGQTTEYLSKKSLEVFSIEPEPILFSNAKEYFSKNKKVKIINGTSEEIFPHLLPKLKGNISFWLDGHFSSGFTFMGTQHTPICQELENISLNLNNFNEVSIIIDDIRDFHPQLIGVNGYPSTDFLINWATVNDFYWHIEHDMFIMKRKLYDK